MTNAFVPAPSATRILRPRQPSRYSNTKYGCITEPANCADGFDFPDTIFCDDDAVVEDFDIPDDEPLPMTAAPGKIPPPVTSRGGKFYEATPQEFSDPRIEPPRRRGLKPQSRIQPPTRETKPREYDGTSPLISTVDRVIPALVYGDKVSIDRVSDHWHLLIIATTTNGREIHVIVSNRGWVRTMPLPTAVMGDDGRGRKVSFAFTTNVPPQLAKQRLSYEDRNKLMKKILDRFLGEPDWERLQMERRRPY